MSLYAVLYANGEETVLHGSDIVDEGCVYLDKDGIEGWYSAPDLKTQPVERSWGNGAHDVPEPDITYSARTLTIHLDLVSTDRASLLALARTVSASTGRLVRFRVVDEGQDTYVDGYVRPEYGPNWFRQIMTGTLTMVCPRPERLSWLVQRGQMWPDKGMSGGLSYGPGGAGLAYPVSYGSRTGGRSSLVVTNQGSADAYPVLTLCGDHHGRMVLYWAGGVLQWSGGSGASAVFDCRTQTVSMGGVDQSRGLSSRAFPVVRPGESVTLRLVEAGDGWVTCEMRDAYL